MGWKENSPSSSIDSSSHPVFSTTSSSSKHSRDLSTDLRLGLSLVPCSSSIHDTSFKDRDKLSDWPPIKPLLRRALTEKHQPTFFVKVYMEGIPIGRKLDLYAHNDYNGLTKALCRMFKTMIICPQVSQMHSDSSDVHVLTYEDKEGDWMMVGDVPWEMFLSTVKRLKITRSSSC